MKHPHLAALVCATLLGACAGKSPDALIGDAREHLQKNDIASAEIELKNALKQNPQSAEGRYLLGLTALAQADYASAESELKRALELKHPADQVVPKLAIVMQKQGAFTRLVKELSPMVLSSPTARADLQAALGSALLTLGREAEAKQAFEIARQAQPDHVGAALGEARMLASHGNTTEAAAQVEAILQRAPKSADAWELKGLLELAANQLDPAIASWRQQIALEPDSAFARARLAGVLIRYNRLKEATPEITYLKKHAPRLAQTHYLDALLAWRERRLDAARDASGRLQNGAPDFVPGILLAGLIESEFKSHPQAEKHFLRVLSVEPEHQAARRALVRTYLLDNQPLRAKDALEPLLAAQPQDAGVAALAGEVFLQTGDIPRAMRELNRASKLNPGDTALTTKVALTRFVQGKPEEGFSELENLAQSKPDDYRPDITLIAARLRAREFDKALAAIDALEKKLPGSSLPANLRGAALLGKGDLVGARKSFDQALQIRPDDFGASMNLAQMDLATNAPQAAVARFESMLNKDPKNLQIALALADLRSRLGASPDEVAAILDKTIAANPQQTSPRIALIALRLRDGDTRRALAAAQQALAVIPAQPEMLDAAARAHEAAGETNQAISLLQKIAAQQTSSPYPWLRIAHLQARTKDYPSARISLRRALDIAPKSLDAQRALISVELAAGNDNDALEAARKLQADEGTAAAGYGLEADIYASKKQWPQMVAAARNGLKVAPRNDLALRVHAGLLAQNQTAEASRFAAEWIKAHADDLAMPLRLGDVAAARGDFASARRHYQQALSIEPTNPVLLNNLAWAAGKLGEPNALELAEKAHQLAPQSPVIKDTLGVLLVERGKVARGLELLQAAIRLAPQDPAIRLNLAKALIAAGKKQEAKRELDTLASLGDRFRGQSEVAQILKKL